MAHRKRRRLPEVDHSDTRGAASVLEATSSESHSSESADHEQPVVSTDAGVLHWNDVNRVFCFRVTQLLRETCTKLLEEVDHDRRCALVVRLRDDLHITYRAGQRYVRSMKRAAYSECVRASIERVVSQLTELVQMGLPRTSFMRSCQRMLEEHGFPEMERDPFARAVAETRQGGESGGYAYSERPSLALPLLPRYDGDKRAEEEHSRGRVGHVVVLPHTHPHAEVNTRIQLIEPRKRRPPLDEFRIFSHPKRMCAYGVEDFLVEEELHHRALVALSTHLDTYGSLHDLTPFARVLVWDLLERDDAAYSELCAPYAPGDDARAQRLEQLKKTLAVHRQSFEVSRVAAREAALQIGWCAVSAQWRDQAICKLASLEEEDWYCIGDVPRGGGSAIFPNYARATDTRALTMGVLVKLDDITHDTGVPPVAAVVESILLPLLSGDEPSLIDFCFSSACAPPGDPYWHRVGMKVRSHLCHHHSRRTKRDDPSFSEGTAPSGLINNRHRSVSNGCSDSHNETIYTWLCSSLVFPLQCLAELLEVCSLALHSPYGMSSFTRTFLSDDWSDEEGVLRYLLKQEPANLSIVPLVGIPRIYRDLITAIQLLSHEKMIPHLIEARRAAGEGEGADLRCRSYAYWRSVVAIFQEEGRFDDLVLLRVSRADEGQSAGRWYSEGCFETAPRVWREDLQALMEEEGRAREMEEGHKT